MFSIPANARISPPLVEPVETPLPGSVSRNDDGFGAASASLSVDARTIRRHFAATDDTERDPAGGSHNHWNDDPGRDRSGW
ncbi:MAG: hypothetical protein R2742_06480 [Micropruina glycogenica]